MTVPYTFASAASPIPLNELDTNFATPITLGSSTMILGGTYTSISGLTLSGATLNTSTLNSPTMVTPVLGTPASGNLANCSGYTYASLAGTVPTWNQNTTGNAATATLASTATNATTAGSTASLITANFSIAESGGKLYFYNGATTIASLDSSGNFISIANITAYGTP